MNFQYFPGCTLKTKGVRLDACARTAALALARQVAMYIARETTNLSYKAIGESFGKDHTTVLHNVKCIENFLRDKPYQKELVDDIIKNLKSDNTAY